ncbi:MAG: hypothetical protein QGG40_05360, partial [Myxococcota bacterium]|nr:hypothetical protein [Myxococcota bacterium]
ALDVSTMWCAPCQELAGEVQATWEDYEDEGFIYLTVLPEDLAGEVPDVEDLNSWADSFGIEAPVLADGSGFGYELVGSDAYPAIMIVARDLTVAVERVTPAEDATIRAAIEDEL